MRDETARKIGRSFVAVVTVAVVLLALISWQISETRHLVAENKHRISDIAAAQASIQRSRRESCRKTYESIRTVFRPFFPPRKGRTEKQQRNLDKFNGIIDQRKAGCAKQTAAGR